MTPCTPVLGDVARVDVLDPKHLRVLTASFSDGGLAIRHNVPEDGPQNLQVEYLFNHLGGASCFASDFRG